ATGDRDKAKRPQMGRIVARLSNYAFVTDEEPYSEDPAKIREDVMLGMRGVEDAAKAEEIADRKEAIRAAIKMAKKGDTVLVTGMGHQQYRVVGDKKEHWDDRQVARSLLKNQNS